MPKFTIRINLYSKILCIAKKTHLEAKYAFLINKKNPAILSKIYALFHMRIIKVEVAVMSKSR